MRALVTGASGFIGRHVVRRLLRDGWQVDAIDLKASDATFGHGQDVLDWFRLRHHVKVDLVVHCAAFVGGRMGIENEAARIAAYDTLLDAAMFEWALRMRPRRIVYWSSSAAYPESYQRGDTPGIMKLREDDISLWMTRPPETSYGEVKLTGERLAGWVRGEGIPVTVLRPFSGYGADQSQDYPFPAYITRARLKLDPFEVWGSGSQVRDFIHVDDVIEVMMRAVANGVDGPINVCSGEGTSFNDLQQLVCKLAGYAPAVRYRTDRPVGVRYRVGDPTKMLQLWEPRVSLEEGIKRALREN